MKKMIFLLFINLFLIMTNTSAQVSQQWVRIYNSSNNYYDYGNDIAIDLQGNVYVTGFTYSGSSLSSYNCVTVKYNASGVQQWAAIYNGPSDNEDGANSIAVDNSGNVYIAGSSKVSTTNDMLIIKYNTNGVLQWLQTYNGPGNGNDGARKVILDAAGNVYVSGGSTGNGTNYDYTTIKYNSSGIQQWIAIYNGPGNGSDYINDAVLDRNGDIYVTGNSKGLGPNGDYATVKYNSSGVPQWAQRYNGPGNSWDAGYAVVVDQSHNSYVTGYTAGIGTGSDITTIKYNSSGSQQWIHTYDGTAVNNDAAYSISIDSAGNVIVGGFSMGVGSDRDCIIIKYNLSGVQQWEGRYNGPGNGMDFINSIAVDINGNIYATGQTKVNNFVYDDYLTMKYSPAGQQQWLIRYNGSGNSSDQATSIDIDGSANVFVTGMSWGSASNWDIGTIKYTQFVGIDPISNLIPDKFSLYQNYPNPFNPVTSIRFDIPSLIRSGAGVVVLKVYDILGREVATLVNEQLSPGTYELSWNASNYPSGVYYYKLMAYPSDRSERSDGYSETKKMILMK